MECRVLKKKKCEITQHFNSNHKAIDMVGENYTLDYIIAHSDGIVDTVQDGYDNMKGSTGTKSYGNYIKLKHNNNYHTLYAHMKKGLVLKKGDYVKKGDILGYMSDSGNAYGSHLHFEIIENKTQINPLAYLNKDLPKQEILLYALGDIVEINGVYISSENTKKLNPLITRGKITKISSQANNPYLLEDGKIGWVNDKVIIAKIEEEKYLENKKYQGESIVDALKQININSSYNYRKELAQKNNIKNYQGTKEQNIELLGLIKQGKLIY